MKGRRALGLFCLAFLLLAGMGGAWAVKPDEMLRDPALEARARQISRNIRCLVCQNQSIDESDADLAHDLRMIIRARLAAGASDSEIVDFLVARYGDYVLLKPPLNGGTALLWAGPFLILGGGLLFLWRHSASRKHEDPGHGTLSEQNKSSETGGALSAAERAKLRRLLADERPKSERAS